MLNEPYVTRAAHGPYPVGSTCRASRVEGVLSLEFEDGVRISLDSRWYAAGLEERPRTLWDIMHDEIVREIDEEILGQLQRYCEAG